MNRFNWIYIDDRLENRERAEAINAKIPGSMLTLAANEDEATKLIKTGFFQLALVDLELQKGQGLGSGLSILGLLATMQPACERIVHSRMFYIYDPSGTADAIDQLFHPRMPLAQGIFDKIDAANLLETIVKERAAAWLNRCVVVGGLQSIAAEFCKPLRSTHTADYAYCDEIDYLISRLCGQGDRWMHSGPQAVESISLEFMEGGATRAVVLRGQPRVGLQTGVWLVFKVDSKADVSQEYTRYRQHICFRVSKTRRVELLGVEIGNQLGAICYTFAGVSPESVSLLSEVVSEDPSKGARAIEQLFHPDQKDLHGIDAQPQSLSDYFHGRFKERFRPRLAIDLLPQIFGAAASKWKDSGLELRDGELHYEGGKLQLDGDLLANPLFHKPMPACVVHGDLHLGNIVVGHRDEVIMIDYKDAGPAPRCLDFAVFDTSLRLQEAKGTSVTEIVRGESRDKLVLRCTWRDSNAESVRHQGVWQQLSLRVQQYLTSTFEEVDQEEYSATCIYWSAHLITLDSLTLEQKLRLIAWMRAHQSCLKAAGSRRVQ